MIRSTRGDGVIAKVSRTRDRRGRLRAEGTRLVRRPLNPVVGGPPQRNGIRLDETEGFRFVEYAALSSAARPPSPFEPRRRSDPETIFEVDA